MKNKKISLNKVFKDAISIYKKSFLFLIIVFALYEALNIPYSTYTGDSWRFFVAYILLDFILFSVLVFAVTTLYIDSKNTLSVRELVTKLSRRFIPLVLTDILFYLLFVLGFIALIVPSLIVMTVFSQASYFVLLENKGVLESFRLSRSLTKGSRRKIFLILVLTFVPLVVVSLFLSSDPLRPYTLWTGLFSIITGSFFLVFYYALWKNLREASSVK